MAPLFLLIGALLALAGPAWAQDYPARFPSRFGVTVLDHPPLRVATVDYGGADDLLALGVQPVTVRDWYGDQPDGLWPWAAPLVQGHPALLKGELNFEQIAATAPDLIIALWSGIDEAQYQKLSRIAPVLAVPPGTGDFALSWEARARLTGQALGKAAEAEAQIAAIHAKLEKVAAAHPGWQGKTATVAFNWDGTPGAYTSADVRPRVLAQMGFRTPAAVDALASPGAEFTARFSPEDLSPMEGDLILWVATDNDYAAVRDLPTRPFLGAVQQGHEVFADVDLAGALSHSSLLSLPWAIDRLVPQIEGVIGK